MEMVILKNLKNELELELENITLAELLRVYLNEDSSVKFAAWKREHPTKKPILSVRTDSKTAKKAVVDAVSKIIKELDKIETDFKKIK